MFVRLNLELKVIIPILSFVVLLIVALYFQFHDKQVSILSAFHTVKHGTLRMEYPDRISVNKPFDVEVYVNSNNQSVNAVGLYLRYEPAHLELISFDTSSSFCQFYPEKKFDNSVGIMSLACGSPHPGFSGESKLLTLTFMPKIVTNTLLSVDPKSQILLSDGKGTDILEEFPQERLSILNSL